MPFFGWDLGIEAPLARTELGRVKRQKLTGQSNKRKGDWETVHQETG